MAKQIGRLLLLKQESTPDSGTFDLNVCGFAARTFSINNNMIDGTLPDCSTPSAVVQQSSTHGIQSFSFSGSGKAVDNASFLALKAMALNQTSVTHQVVWPGDGTYQGELQVESFEVSGDTEGELDFSCTCRFSEAVSFTAE